MYFWDSPEKHRCCLTGHRILPRSRQEREAIKDNLRKVIASLAGEDVTVFYTGGARGFDTMAAITVLEMKALFPEIRLYLALPHPDQAEKWPRKERELYEQIKEHADQIQFISPVYTSDCMRQRNYYMVEHSRICAYYMVKTVRSGTAQTVNYAQKMGCRMIDLTQEVQGTELEAKQLEEQKIELSYIHDTKQQEGLL